MSTTKLKRMYIIACVCILGIFAVFFVGTLVYLYQFAHETQENATVIEVEIQKGKSAKQIAQILEDSGVISSAQAFYYYARFMAQSSTLPKAGFYDLSKAQSPAQILEILQKGRVKQLRVTIPEGANKSQIAHLLAEAGFGSEEEFSALMSDADFIAFIESEFDSGIKLSEIAGGIEGYLFPDTYLFPKGTHPVRILRRIASRLNEVISPELKQRILEQHFSLHEVLTLASIIEKETSQEIERSIIAGVFLNRLALGMRLQTDPTVIYGIPHFDGNIRKSDLQNPHPYNTYVHTGLPPGPIASPGLNSIVSVLWPAATEHLFFVSRNDGTHEFCPNLKCHEKAVTQWQRNKTTPRLMQE